MSSESPSAEMADMNTPSPGEVTATTPNTSVSGTSNANASNPTSNSSAPRRPPRKSTLTQQQKNQKRQRATQDQLVTLEMEFSKNPTPNAAVRERIASDINMTERSVQIWFQNRYVPDVFCMGFQLTLSQPSPSEDQDARQEEHRRWC